jgi:ParB family chromosome partitioning protein
LSFAKIDPKIWEAVGNTSKVSSRTAREILSISTRGKRYTKALIELAEEIRNGLGAASLKKAVESIILGDHLVDDSEKVLTLPSGAVIATWKNNSLKFSNNIEFNQKQLENHLIEFFNKI